MLTVLKVTILYETTQTIATACRAIHDDKMHCACSWEAATYEALQQEGRIVWAKQNTKIMVAVQQMVGS